MRIVCITGALRAKRGERSILREARNTAFASPVHKVPVMQARISCECCQQDVLRLVDFKIQVQCI